MYLLADGTEVTKDQIAQAVKDGKARLVNGRGDGKTTTSLILDGEDFDTRGECESMWEESWTTTPNTVEQALYYARC